MSGLALGSNPQDDFSSGSLCTLQGPAYPLSIFLIAAHRAKHFFSQLDIPNSSQITEKAKSLDLHGVQATGQGSRAEEQNSFMGKLPLPRVRTVFLLTRHEGGLWRTVKLSPSKMQCL